MTINVIKRTKHEIKKLLEADSSENSFIYTSSDNIPYMVRVEIEEDGGVEFYVDGKDGKLLDIFKPENIDKDGVISAKIRQGIMAEYKNRQSSEEETLEEMDNQETFKA